MERLLRLLVIVLFVTTQAASVEAAICRHGSPLAHAAALRSHDRGVAAQALNEDTAGSVAGKKGSFPGGGSMSPASDMLTPPAVVHPARAAERVRIRPADAPPWTGTSVRPLLQPPLG